MTAIHGFAGFQSAVPAAKAGAGNSTSASASVAGAEKQADGLSFGQLLENAVTDFSQTLHASEAASIGGIDGSVPTQQVVESIMKAEQQMHMAIAVRDKVVAAYQEISRMAI